MKERPVLFNARMVRAILAGTKTQTRRLVTVPWKGSRRSFPYEPYCVDADGVLQFCDEYGDYHDALQVLGRPYGAPGDQLWVRETFQVRPPSSGCELAPFGYDDLEQRGVIYQATWDRCASRAWKPSIHMPRWASRITLEVTDVGVERLQAITEREARAEGVTPGEMGVGYLPAYQRGPYGYTFAALWESINGERAPWSANPWVWVITFKRVIAGTVAA